MRNVWRSWFWNTVLFVLLGVMAAISTGLVFSFEPIAAILFFSAMSVVLWAGVIRALMLGVIATDEGVKIRALLYNDFVPWRDITEIGVGPVGSGLSNLLGATCPYLRRPRVAASPEELDYEDIELSMLGGYSRRVNATAQSLRDRWSAARAGAS